MVLMMAVLAGPAGAQPLPQADQTAVQDVIGRQIEAFRHDDAAAAFAFAAPNIQLLFGTPERFLDMVRTAYKAVKNPRSVEFGDLVSGQGEVTQDVELVGPDGQPEKARYTLEKDATGTWRIAGCVLLRSERLAV